MPDEEYPFQLTTGRRLAFHNTGTMTQDYKKVKDPEELLEICEEDAAEHGIEDGDFVQVSSRRGTVEAVKARVTDRVTAWATLYGLQLPGSGPNQRPDHQRRRPAVRNSRTESLRGEHRESLNNLLWRGMTPPLREGLAAPTSQETPDLLG